MIILFMWHQSGLVQAEDVDRILGEERPTSCILDPFPPWLLKEATTSLSGWLWSLINSTLSLGIVPASFKETVIQPLLKKPSLDSEDTVNYRPVSNFSFLGKVLKRTVASQLQGFPDDAGCLQSYQSGFWPGFRKETALVTLFDDLKRDL